nr:DNA/RNA non-specific endonuclease [Sphingomonas beigongshangi]
MRRHSSHPLTSLSLKAPGRVADSSAVAAVAFVEREHQERGGGADPKRRPSPLPGSAPAGASSDQIAATHRTAARLASTPSEEFRTVVRNGYAYHIDARGRTRRVSGTLTIAEAPRRSRTSQRQAGGTKRRASDDGGHYIAVRFDGPTDAFNHFAQDRNFNRGGYRLLEHEWARDKRVGRAVTVRIVPQFRGKSVRPSTINLWWTVDGRERV